MIDVAGDSSAVRDLARKVAVLYADKAAAGADVSDIERRIVAATDVWNEEQEIATVERRFAVSDELKEIAGRLEKLAVPPAGVSARTPVTVNGALGNGHSPAIAATDDGMLWLAWLEYVVGAGDVLHAQRRTGDAHDASDNYAFGGPAGLMRPTLTARGSDAWLLHAAADDGRWQVVAQPLDDQGPSERPESVSTGDASAFNQEAVLDDCGHLHVVYQAAERRGYQIVYRERRRGEWCAPRKLSPPGANHWDPVITVDRDQLWVAWSAWLHGQYRLVVRRRRLGGRWEQAHVVPAPEARHAVHPDIASGDGGTLWLAFDELTIPNLSGSGGTAYRPTALLTRNDQGGTGAAQRMTGSVSVRVFDGRSFSDPSLTCGPSPAAAAVGGLPGYPKIRVDDLGRVWLAHRVRRQMPFRKYYTEVAAVVLAGDQWHGPRIMPSSDAAAVEPAMALGTDGVWLAWHGDNRRRTAVELVEGFGGHTSRDRIEAEHLGGVTWDADRGVGTVHACYLDTGGLATASSRHGASRGRALPPVGLAVAAARRTPRRSGPDGLSLYWGDLHRHSNISRCLAGWEIEPEDHFRFAQDSSAYDFWALTDHAEHTSDFNWHHIKKLASLYHNPGTFLPLVGFEWTSRGYGHMNVIYADSDGPIFSSRDELTDTPEKLWTALGERRAITIPHHPSHLAFPTSWSERNDRFLRVVELFQSSTGSYESDWCLRQAPHAVASGSSVTDALSRGYRLGFVGSTDHRYGATYVGVYCRDLTRELVFDALRERRCFAASAKGIEPYIAIGAATMGCEVRFSAEASISIGGRGTRELSKVQLIEDGSVVKELTRPGFAHAARRTPIDIRLEVTADGPRNWDGSLVVHGTASIVATEYVPAQVSAISRREATWRLRHPEFLTYQKPVPPAVCTLGFTVDTTDEGRDAAVEITAAGRTIRVPVGDLRDGVEVADRFAGGTIRVRRGVGGLTGLGTARIRRKLNDVHVSPGHWYYVRVVQVDGEMAWSSPIWVD